MEIFYSKTIEGGRIIFDDEETHHCLRVMRHRSGDQVRVADGKGKLFLAKLVESDKRNCVLEIMKIEREETSDSPYVHIAIAPTKNADRFEFFLEKATEIGVSEITPLICRRSERSNIRPERMEKILLSAMKQSLRLWLPKRNLLMTFADVVKEHSAATKSVTQRFIAHCHSQNLPAIKTKYKAGENVILLIGPEGDFTAEEIQLAEGNGFSSISLSTARLRTETAGLVAVQILNS